MKTIFIVIFAITGSLAMPSPVKVSILTDTSKDGFYVGDYDRTRFDLIESYNPLATASVAKESDVMNVHRARAKVLKARAKGVRTIVGEDNDMLFNQLDFSKSAEMSFTKPQDGVVKGAYLEWTSWSPCINGQRSRVRACTSRRAARRVVCEGPAKETQMCFSTDETNIPVASDPWTIEREISGQMEKLRHESEAR